MTECFSLREMGHIWFRNETYKYLASSCDSIKNMPDPRGKLEERLNVIISHRKTFLDSVQSVTSNFGIFESMIQI